MNHLNHESGRGPCVGELRPREITPRQMLVAGLLAAVLVAAPSMTFAESKAAEVSQESGLGAAAALSSLIYGPVKILYATGGVIVGGFAYLFTAGDSEVAEKVFTRSLRGDYVITPAILLGHQRLEFIGRDLDDSNDPARIATTPTHEPSVASAIPAYDDTADYDDLGW